MSKFRWFIAAVAAVAFLPVGLAAQETGTVTGTVTDEGTGNPIGGVQVFVEGTNLGTLSGQDGSFNIGNVPAGEQEVRATILGYTAGSQNVTVQAGEEVAANFALEESAVALEGFTVQASGERARVRELGTNVGRISVPDVELSSVTSMSDLLQGRAAGVTIRQSGGTTGTGARVRIRGAASVSLSNEPLLIIDGVRTNNSAESFSIGLGGQSISRLNDLNPEDIESIEILKGPAAAALYGTAAATGVIQVTTKQGQSGAARWNFYTEQGTVNDVTTYPANWSALGTDADGETVGCPLFVAAQGDCVQTDVRSLNPIEEASPFRTGQRQKYGANVTGGSEQVTYYISGEYSDEEGVYEINRNERVSLRANLQSQVSDDLDLGVQAGYTTGNLSLPPNDNNTFGILSGALLGNVNEANSGYLILPPDRMFANNPQQQTDRITGSMNANWRPIEWLSFAGTLGLDNLLRHDNSTIAAGAIPVGLTGEGSRTSNRAGIGTYTANVSATGGFDLTPSITSTTTLGSQYTEEIFRQTSAFGGNLLPGTGTLAGTSERFAVNEFFTNVRTLGTYLQQRFGLNDRIFLSAAVRADDDSSFGDQFGVAYYPSASASWVVGEENWFPQTDAFSSLRLRAAYGRSGLRPGFRQAFDFFTPTAATIGGADVPAFTISTLSGASGTGNPNLRPEVSDEFELGFDAGLFGERVGLEMTYYNKISSDALIERRLSPSLGVAAVRFENLGKVQNEGVELLLNTQLLNLPQVSWDATVSGSFNRNELLELGEGIEPIIFGLGGASHRHQEGFPLGGFWDRGLESFEVGENGLVGPGDVVIEDEARYFGSNLPTREFAFSTSATLFDVVTLSALFDHQGGHIQNNSTRFFRCATFVNCQDAHDPNTSPEAQAEVVAGLLGGRGAFYEDATFTKLRELSLTFAAPGAVVDRLPMGAMSLTLSGRNLATWTDYTGFDPEVNSSGQTNHSTADFLTQPPVRYFTARLNVNF